MHPIRIAILLFVVLAAIWSRAWADNTVNVSNPAVLPGESAAQCYIDATTHLRKGEWFERAIAQLKEAVRQDSKNLDYHLALGCAYADRVASLGWALSWRNHLPRAQDAYRSDLADWQKDQNDPSADDYEKPAPMPPPAAIYLKDDGTAFTEPTADAAEQLQHLCREAQDEWKLAIRLAPSPAAKANAEYVEGWGMLVLEGYRVPGAIIGYPGDTLTVLTGFPTHQDILDAITAATHDDPTKAIYWQSLGDVLGRPSDDPAGNDSDPKSGHAGMPAYRRALALAPKNALLLYYLSQYEMHTHPAQALADLKAAIQADPTNAFTTYLLAASMMQQTGFEGNHRNNAAHSSADFTDQETFDRTLASSLTDQDTATASKVLALIDQADGEPSCFYPVYHPAVPDLLTPAYDYQFRTWFDQPALHALSDLGRDLAGEADIEALQGNLEQSYSIDRRIITFGEKLIGDWPIHADILKGRSLLMVIYGTLNVTMAYRDMIRNAQHYGPADAADGPQAELDAFMAERKAYYAQVKAAGDDDFYKYY